jgi:RNA polymerase sigma factor (sigma-70 family)
VRTIARQRIIDLWRRARAQKRAEEMTADESALERPDPQAHPASSMVRAEEAQARLLSVMSELSDRHRRVLELREDEGLDYDAISARLGLPQPEAARYLYAYARSRRADLMRAHYDSVIVG